MTTWRFANERARTGGIMLTALALSIGLNIGLGGSVVALWRARERTYRYAVDRADFTPEGRAYSDMATVHRARREGVIDAGTNELGGLAVSELAGDDMSRPVSPGLLWAQAEREQPHDESARAARYHELMVEHGHIVKREPGQSVNLPCGWPHKPEPEDVATGMNLDQAEQLRDAS